VAQRPHRSLRHEYELFVEEEIENYKESLPRSALLKLGDEAAQHLAGEQQLALTALLLCEEVDRLIRLRLRIPTYDSWRRRRLKLLAEMRRPEHWGLRADDLLVRKLRPRADGHVLVAGARGAGSALYLAANGCAVTAIAADEDVVRRVMAAAAQLGLSERVHGQIADLASWTPDAPLTAVVCTSRLLADLPSKERAAAIERLKVATTAGGIHVVRNVDRPGGPVSVDELRKRYRGWDVTIDSRAGAAETFLARKLAS